MQKQSFHGVFLFIIKSLIVFLDIADQNVSGFVGEGFNFRVQEFDSF